MARAEDRKTNPMKLPIAIGNRFFFRVVFPGAITAASCARLTQTILQHYGVRIPIDYAFPAEIFIFGWVFVVLDMPLYMAFEGRRFGRLDCGPSAFDASAAVWLDCIVRFVAMIRRG